MLLPYVDIVTVSHSATIPDISQPVRREAPQTVRNQAPSPRKAKREATLRAALEREPEYAEAHDLLGRIQSELGPLESAIHHLERALDLNPYLSRTYPDLMKVYSLSGRWQDVDEIARKELDAQYHAMSRAAIALRLMLWNDRPSLRHIVERHLEELEARETDMVVQVLRTGEFSDEVRHRLDRIIRDWPASRRKIAVGQIGAEMAAYTGDADAVIEYIDRAIEDGLSTAVWIRHCPLFDEYRESPEFLRRLGRIEGRGEAVDTPEEFVESTDGV